MTTNTDALRSMYSHIQSVFDDLKAHLEAHDQDQHLHAWLKNTECALGAIVDDIDLHRGFDLMERGADTPADFMATSATISRCYLILAAIRYGAMSLTEPDTVPAANSASEFLANLAELTRRKSP